MDETKNKDIVYKKIKNFVKENTNNNNNNDNNKKNITDIKYNGHRHHHYLIIFSPPDWGSTALEGLLSSSPHVDTMCKAKTWACEETWLLIKHGLFEREERWNETKTNWTRAYEIYHQYAWDNTKHFLMDKSPPNIAKVHSLHRFFVENKYEYSFIILTRHPCLQKIGRLLSFQKYAVFINDALNVIPQKNRIIIHYEELVGNPYAVSAKLLHFLPDLNILNPNKNRLFGPGESNIRYEPLTQFKSSEHCTFQHYKEPLFD